MKKVRRYACSWPDLCDDNLILILRMEQLHVNAAVVVIAFCTIWRKHIRGKGSNEGFCTFLVIGSQP